MALTVGEIYVCALAFAIVKNAIEPFRISAKFTPFIVGCYCFIMLGWCRVTRNVALAKRHAIRWFRWFLSGTRERKINQCSHDDRHENVNRNAFATLGFSEVPGGKIHRIVDWRVQVREKWACSWVVSFHVKRRTLIHIYSTLWFDYRIKWNVATFLFLWLNFAFHSTPAGCCMPSIQRMPLLERPTLLSF